MALGGPAVAAPTSPPNAPSIPTFPPASYAPPPHPTADPTAPPSYAPPGTGPIAGRKRSFGRGLLLTIVTLTIYAYYWHYKVYEEFRLQFRRSEEFPTLIFVVCIIPFISIVGMIIFMSKFIDMKEAIRHELQMAPGLSFKSFLIWYVLGTLIIVGPLVAYYKLQNDINEVWDRTLQGRPLPAPQPTYAPA